MAGRAASSSVDMNKYLVHRFAHVALTARALVAWFNLPVRIQHKMRTFFDNTLATKSDDCSTESKKCAIDIWGKRAKMGKTQLG
jgi:hypothetical protein